MTLRQGYRLLPFLVLGTLYLGCLLVLWPGVVSPDAQSQYLQAVSGLYNDHHPPMMSVLWRYLDHLYTGPGLLFSLHMTMLYASAGIFVYLFNHSKFRWWYVFYPLIPNHFAFAVLLVKDASFAFSYLLASAILALLIMRRPTRYGSVLMAAVIILLFYGTAVKFQAKYVLPFFTMAVAYCMGDYVMRKRTILYGIMLYAGMLGGVTLFDHYMVPQQQQSHSWQYVKLYDLTGISLAMDKEFYPEFVLRDDGYDFGAVQALFDRREVDKLVFAEKPLLRMGRDDRERDELLYTWRRTVLRHPLAYLWVRVKLCYLNFVYPPSDRGNPTKYLAKTSLAAMLEIPSVSYLLEHGYNMLQGLFKFILLLPALCYYIWLGVTRLHKSAYAKILLLYSAASAGLILVLLFCSMAASARYVMFCSCLLHVAHGFAYMTRERYLVAVPAKRSQAVPHVFTN